MIGALMQGTLEMLAKHGKTLLQQPGIEPAPFDPQYYFATDYAMCA